jgi:hypothetical protein
MIRQDGNGNQNRTGRSKEYAQYIPAAIATWDYLTNQGGPKQSGTQTSTQQNLPDYAVPFAQNTLDMGRYFTNNPNYRPRTLDQDYSGIRGFNPDGSAVSQVGQFGLNPSYQVRPPGPVAPPPDRFNILPGIKYTPEKPAMEVFGKGQLSFDQYQQYQGLLDQGMSEDEAFSQAGGTPFPKRQGPLGSNFGEVTSSRGGGRVARADPSGSAGTEGMTEYEAEGGYTGPGWDLDGDGKGYYYDGPGANESNNGGSSDTQTQTQANIQTQGMSPEEIQALIDQNLQQFDQNTITPDEMPTPFQSYDRQRFTAPGADTVRAEGILAGRYGQRFGPNGTDPFAAANQAVGNAANYTSGFQGTTGGIGGQAGNYRGSLATAQDPGIFQSKSYTTPGLQNTFSNPNAGLTNVNAGMRNVNAGLQSSQYGNANRGLQGPVNYERDQSFEQSMQRFMDPYTDRVVNQTMRDLDRVRQMQNSGISGSAARSGAFGGSRSQLALTENNRNVADRTAAAVGQLRSQGFQNAAQLAQQEAMQRLGLTASDVQNVRGLQSQGNLQGQRLSADDLQNVRGLTSQGALAAQGLRSQGALNAQNLGAQGALAALNANAGLYGQALGLNAGMDRTALQANAGLLSNAMSLDAADLRDRRATASDEAKFSELANRAAGALNLQGGTALGDLAQMGTADERQRIADLVASGQAGDARNQQDLDFIYNEFMREQGYPQELINLRNSAISPATGSVVTTSSPLYGQNPLLQALGIGLSGYSLLNDE